MTTLRWLGLPLVSPEFQPVNLRLIVEGRIDFGEGIDLEEDSSPSQQHDEGNEDMEP